MSIDSTSSTLYRKKTLKSALSQPDNYLYSRHSLKDRQINRTTSVAEENTNDTLTDLSSLPHMLNQPDNHKRNRRFSEVKPIINQQKVQGINSERRNSTSQINFSSLLPNAFRFNKHNHHKSGIKDETNTSIDTLNNSYSFSSNDTMTMKTEPFLSSKIFNSNTNGSRTNLSISSEISSTISHEDSLSSLFTYDMIQLEYRSAEILLLKLNTPLCVAEIYREHFFDYFHINYYGELQHEGPFIVSLRYIYTKSDNPNYQARAIIRIPSRNYDVSVIVDGTNEDNILQVLFKNAYLSNIQTYKAIGDPKANEKIYSFDKSNDERQHCKIGFIYQRSEQRDETEIFNNDTITNDIIDFLQILGDRIRLKGFDKYRGDLDIKNDLHGEYSYHTQYNNHEIMFNVAPMIPSLNSNGQCVKRKGLVGNSFVCIVFQESDTEFIPDFISGKVTQIYIIVQPIKNNEKIYYKIGIWHRNDLTSIIDPPGGIYEYDTYFRDYFLTLLLNSINVAIESPSLRFCISEQRQRLKLEELKKLTQNLSMGQNLDHITNGENTNSYLEQRSNSRHDNVISTNDNIVQDSGRVSPSLPPALPKKRTLSKILSSVFTTTRGSSISTPTSTSNNDSSFTSPSSTEVNITPNRTVSLSNHNNNNKEPIKRAASVKHRPAPSPPIPQRAPISYKYGNTSTYPYSSTHSIILNPSYLTNNIISSQNNLLSISAQEESVRNRSNSSPGDHANTTTKRPLSNVSTNSREISDTSSSIDDFSDSESNDDDDKKYEHRPTLTEHPTINSSTTNL